MPDMPPKEVVEVLVRQRLETWAKRLDNENATPSLLVGQSLDDRSRVLLLIRSNMTVGELRQLLRYCLDEIKELDDGENAAPDLGDIRQGQDGSAAARPVDR